MEEGKTTWREGSGCSKRRSRWRNASQVKSSSSLSGPVENGPWHPFGDCLRHQPVLLAQPSPGGRRDSPCTLEHSLKISGRVLCKCALFPLIPLRLWFDCAYHHACGLLAKWKVSDCRSKRPRSVLLGDSFHNALRFLTLADSISPGRRCSADAENKSSH